MYIAQRLKQQQRIIIVIIIFTYSEVWWRICFFWPSSIRGRAVVDSEQGACARLCKYLKIKPEIKFDFLTTAFGALHFC